MPTSAEQTFARLQHETAKRHAHARSCQQSPERCQQCIDNRRFFDSLPLDTLARVLGDSSRLVDKTTV